MKNVTNQLCLSLILTAGSLPGANIHAAGEAALYELAPKDSAFIRIVNNIGDKAVNARFGDLQLEANGFCHASTFQFIQPGRHTLDNSPSRWKGELLANHAYTFILSQDGTSVIEDKVFDNPRKAQFASFNLTDRDTIAIKTTDGSKTVFADVSKDGSISRTVNPLKIAFAAFDADTPLVTSGNTVFKRGQSTSLFVCGNKDAYQASWSHN